MEASVIKNVAEAPTKELVTLPLVIVFEGMMIKDRESRQRARARTGARETERRDRESMQRAGAGREQEQGRQKAREQGRQTARRRVNTNSKEF